MGVYAHLRQDPESFENFANLITSRDFKLEVQHALSYPDSYGLKTSLAMLVLFSPSKHLDATSLDQNNMEGQMLAMVRKYGGSVVS